MPSIPCPISITCPGSDDPISNYSSEATDGVDFTRMAWPIIVVDPSIGPDPNKPNIPVAPTWYQKQGCLSLCTALTEELAQLCANMQAFMCPPTPDPNVPSPQFFYNNPQTVTIICADPSTFTWTIGAGYFVGLSQAAVDAQAQQYALIQANARRICLSEIQVDCCAGTPYSSDVDALCALDAVAISLIGGALPPGLTFSQTAPKTATISGTPTTPGDYTFTIQGQTVSNGAVQVRQYTISVLGIVEDSLPSGAKGSAYSESITGAGGNPGYLFDIISGSLPLGLTMADDGTISGTPTAVQIASFTVRITDENINSCTKDFTIVVNAPTPSGLAQWWNYDGSKSCWQGGSGPIPSPVPFNISDYFPGNGMAWTFVMPAQVGALNFTIHATIDSYGQPGPFAQPYVAISTAPGNGATVIITDNDLSHPNTNITASVSCPAGLGCCVAVNWVWFGYFTGSGGCNAVVSP